jgi:hypothetical protein
VGLAVFVVELVCEVVGEAIVLGPRAVCHDRRVNGLVPFKGGAVLPLQDVVAVGVGAHCSAHNLFEADPEGAAGRRPEVLNHAQIVHALDLTNSNPFQTAQTNPETKTCKYSISGWLRLVLRFKQPGLILGRT